MSFRDTLKSLGLGRAAYRLWHQPVGAVRQSIAEGGPLHQWLNARGRHAMVRAAATLPTARTAPAAALPELHFLTGKKFWYQTAFCLHALQHYSGRTFRAVLHDDGSFDAATIDQLQTLFPAAQIRRRAANDARVATALPPERFPFLHDRRKYYPNILKLTDAHAGARGWQLVLDSDMLFFRRPDFLLAWLAAPDRPLHMTDVGDAYGYPTPLLSELAGAPIPHLVNVGLTGLHSEQLDWEKIEFWCRRLIETHGTSYYLEQALIAMLLAGKNCAVAPAADYVLAPNDGECLRPRAVLHHYVGLSKRGYFRHAWRHLTGAAQPSSHP
jgi:hypothetical protein